MKTLNFNFYIINYNVCDPLVTRISGKKYEKVFGNTFNIFLNSNPIFRDLAN